MTIELAADEYTFKIKTGDTWYGNDGTIEGECDNWGFRTTGGDCTLNITEAGNYTFTVNVSDTSRLGVTITKAADVEDPTEAPTDAPVDEPTDAPTDAPTEAPTDAPTDAPTEAPTDAPENTVYFVNSGKWSKANAYAWNDGGSTASTWPGTAMTKTGDKAPNGCDVYTITYTKAYTNIIFNDGSSQTSDLTFEAGKYYDFATDKWYANLEDVPNTQPSGYTVYCVNSKNWSKVNAYVWNPNGAGWPGTAMTKTGDKSPKGYDVYSFTSTQKHGNIIFNNGSGTQTADLTFQSGQYFDLATNKWYTSLDAIK